MGYSTSILQNPVCACDKKKDRWRSKSGVVPSSRARLLVSELKACLLTSRGAQQLSLCQVPGWSEILQPRPHPQLWGEEITQKMMALFCFVFLQMKHQSTEAYGVSWFPVCRPGSEELPGEFSEEPQLLECCHESGRRWGRAAARLAPSEQPSCMPSVPCCVLSYLFISLAGLKCSVVARWCALFLPEFLVSRTFKLSFLG